MIPKISVSVHIVSFSDISESKQYGIYIPTWYGLDFVSVPLKASYSVNFERFTGWRLSHSPGFVKLWESPGRAGGLPKRNYLSGGEQQMLTVVRTLMGNPRVILVDEPTEGLAPLIVKDVLDMLATVRKSGVTILLVEQNFKAAVKVADRFYIMSKGQIVFAGNTAELLAAEEVRKNYLEV